MYIFQQNTLQNKFWLTNDIAELDFVGKLRKLLMFHVFKSHDKTPDVSKSV